MGVSCHAGIVMIHLLGPTSIVGFNLARLFPDEIQPICTSQSTLAVARVWPRLNLQDQVAVAQLFRDIHPTHVLYADAICDVPQCEKNDEWAWQVNVLNLENVLAVLPKETRLVYLSSDHVFGGDGHYNERSDPCPISAYGRTRVAAEQRVLVRPGSLVIRAGLPIGPSIDGRTGHLDWLRYRHRQGLPITIIQDEFRSAVWVEDLARRLMRMIQSPLTGIRHISAQRVISRPELANFLNEKFTIGNTFQLISRHAQSYPHIGHVGLETGYQDEWAAPLPSVVSLLQ